MVVALKDFSEPNRPRQRLTIKEAVFQKANAVKTGNIDGWNFFKIIAPALSGHG
jgi:hypothetical protein